MTRAIQTENPSVYINRQHTGQSTSIAELMAYMNFAEFDMRQSQVQ